MKLSKKRTCFGCKALSTINDRCDLGFEIKVSYQVDGFGLTKYHPMVKCYKPTTNSQALQAIRLTSKY